MYKRKTEKLIDAYDLLEKLPEDLPYKASVRRVLTQAPEGITRCKRCAYAQPITNSKNVICKAFKGARFQTDFCSFGELRADLKDKKEDKA